MKMFILICALGLLLSATKPSSWQPDPATTQRFAKRYADRNYDVAKIPQYTLPDALASADGTRVATPQASRQ